VYGSTTEAAPETHPLNPQSWYAETKVAAEDGLTRLADDSFAVTFARFGSGFGWGPCPRLDLVLNRLAVDAARSKALHLNDDGSAYRPFIHVADMAAALEHLGVRGLATRGATAVNVCQPDGNLRVVEAVSRLAALFDTEVGVEPGRVDQRSYQLDTSRLSDLGFCFDRSIDDRIRSLWSWATGQPRHDQVDAPVDNPELPISVTTPLVTPAVLAPQRHTAFLDDVSRIVTNSRYRVGGGHADTATGLVSDAFDLPRSMRAALLRSGTDALVRALQLAGVVPHDCVLVPDQAFHAVAASVLAIGATPIPVDIRADDFNLCAEALGRELDRSPATAVIAVDNFGTPCDWAGLASAAHARGVPLIVDACESLGSQREGQLVVEHADLVVVSFSFTKPVHAAGMGGALIAANQLIDRLEADPALLYRQVKLPELNAAYLCRMWDQLPANIERLRENYELYTEQLVPLGFSPQSEFGISTRIHAPFLVPRDWTSRDRDTLIRDLTARGIGATHQFPLQSVHLGLGTSCRTASEVDRRLISLPTGAGLERRLLDGTAAAIQALSHGGSPTIARTPTPPTPHRPHDLGRFQPDLRGKVRHASLSRLEGRWSGRREGG
jgi:dTDP-4-amino-4,6-dideoxygalactose transaminase